MIIICVLAFVAVVVGYETYLSLISVRSVLAETEKLVRAKRKAIERKATEDFKKRKK